MQLTPVAQACRPDAAVLVEVRNPFAPLDEHSASRIDLAGAPSVRDAVLPLILAHPGVPLAVNVNGQWLLREAWGRPVCPGDIVSVCHEVQGGGGSDPLRVVLQLAAMIAIVSVLGPGGAMGLTGWQAAGAMLAANMAAAALINNLIPPEAAGAGGGGPQASPTYNAALSGNQARLEQPIPVGYGYQRSYPDFAAQPYTIFGDDPADATKQDAYYHALLCLGQGEYAVRRLELDDTAISHFQDVQYAVLPPGTAPTLVAANLVTAPEVAAQDLNTGEYVGAFTVCGPGLQVNAIGIDIVWPRGLGLAAGGGTLGSATVTWQVSARKVDDFGLAIGAWTVLGAESYSAATNTPQRKSYSYTVPAGRYEVRVVRTNAQQPDNHFLLDQAQWTGLRGTLTVAAPLASTATHIEVKMRASDQLSGLTQRKIGALWVRKLRAWSPGGGWTAVAESRSIAWAIADILTNTVYGEGLPDSQVDLQTLYELDAVWTARQDRFDFLYDSPRTAYQAANLAARAGRAVCIPRGSVMSVMRDQAQTLPVAMWTPRNMVAEGGRSSFSMPVALPNSATADAVVLKYWSNRSWDWARITCLAPGVTTPANPVEVTLEGVTGAKQAEREGLYMVADTYYRRCFPEWTAELDGLLPAYGALVLVAHDLPEWGQNGDVAEWNAATLTMTLTEPPEWGDGQHYIRLQRPDGSAHDAILCSPGAAIDQVILAAAPDFTPTTADAGKDRTRYSFGNAGAQATPCRVKGLDWRGLDRVRIMTVAEDDRVHAADNALLPSPSEVQDPIDADYSAIDDGAGGVLLLPNIGDTTLGNPGTNWGEYDVTLRLLDDGSAESVTVLNQTGPTYQTLALPSVDGGAQWLLNTPITPAQAAAFEVRASVLASPAAAFPGATLTGTVDAWLSLGTTREWVAHWDGAEGDGFPTWTLRLEIRDTASQTLQASAVYTLRTGFLLGA